MLASLAEVTEASRRDAGCLEYFWAEDLEAPNTFRFFECWESQELLDAHLAAPHEVAFGERNLHRITGATASFFDASPRPRPCPRPTERGAYCGAKYRGSDPVGTLAPFVCASCRWPSSSQ